MLAHRQRRWANIKPTLGQRLVFAHNHVCSCTMEAVFTDSATNTPSKDEKLNQCRVDVGPLSMNLAQH